jgi:hypothetical protein
MWFESINYLLHTLERMCSVGTDHEVGQAAGKIPGRKLKRTYTQRMMRVRNARMDPQMD